MASPETDAFHSKDRRDDFPIFIHSELDDYGLDPVEFRVYSRLARRAGQHGKHSESVPNMAREFDVSVRKVQYALKLLILCRLVTRHPRPGKTDEYSLNPRSNWENKAKLKDLRDSLRLSGAPAEGTRSGAPREGGAPAEGGVVHRQHGVVVHPGIDEGTPSEGTPIKEEEESRGYPFDHFAVVEYSRHFKTELAIFQAEAIATTVVDSEESRAVWSDVLRTFKGNGYQARYAGNALDRYVKDRREIAAGKKPHPLVVQADPVTAQQEKQRRQEELARRWHGTKSA
jgi:hypothetical protein